MWIHLSFDLNQHLFLLQAQNELPIQKNNKLGSCEMLDKHDLHHEFPEYYDRIHELKASNNHFARLFEEYHDINREILRIEEGVENTSDDYLEELKKKRLAHKDKLYGMIVNS